MRMAKADLEETSRREFEENWVESNVPSKSLFSVRGMEDCVSSKK